MRLKQVALLWLMGSIWEVGTYTQNGTGRLKRHRFTQPFAGKPALFLTLQTSHGGQAVTVRAKTVTANGFDSALYEQESLMDGYVGETVGYLAIYQPVEEGTAAINGQSVSYAVSQQHVNHQWIAVANGMVRTEEEQSRDRETVHTRETLSLLEIGQLLFAQDISLIGGDPIALRQKP